jgi:hypothetical protein
MKIGNPPLSPLNLRGDEGGLRVQGFKGSSKNQKNNAKDRERNPRPLEPLSKAWFL